MGKILKDFFQQHALLGLILAGSCVVIYVVGFFYQKFINSAADLVALVFIVAIYVGAIYTQIKGADK